MLIITRKANQAIELHLESGERVTISVLRLQGSRVRLAVNAPQSVHVVRSELPLEARRPAGDRRAS